MIVSIEEVKQHLRIDIDYRDEDNYIESLILVAEEVIEGDLRRGLSEFEGNVPQSLKHAVLLLIGDFYNNREDSSDLKFNQIPNGVKRLIAKYVSYK